MGKQLSLLEDDSSLANDVEINSGHKECSTCHKVLPLERFEANYRNLDGSLRRSSRCIACKKEAYKHLQKLKRLHPPPPKGTPCMVPGCCRPGTALDHDHKTGAARGYICTQHNSAFAYCGDSAQGVKNLLAYAKLWEGGFENDLQ